MGRGMASEGTLEVIGPLQSFCRGQELSGYPADISACFTMFDQPEYVHVVTNHLPLIGLPVAMVALIAALITRNRTATLIGLGLVCLLALSVWPVSYFGEGGYDRVLSMTDAAGRQFLHHHRELADRWSFLYYITAGVGGVRVVLALARTTRIVAP